jgi:hypothetical protein
MLGHLFTARNHFSVKRAMTSYERTTGRFYSGKVAMYGETVLGCLKTSLKRFPQSTKGIWLSKTTVIATSLAHPLEFSLLEAFEDFLVLFNWKCLVKSQHRRGSMAMPLWDIV